MLYCAVCCAVLYCALTTLLYCAFLCCALLCFAVLYSSVLCFSMLCFAVLYSSVLCFSMLCFTVLCCALLFCTVLYFAVLCLVVLCYAVPLVCYLPLLYSVLLVYVVLQRATLLCLRWLLHLVEFCAMLYCRFCSAPHLCGEESGCGPKRAQRFLLWTILSRLTMSFYPVLGYDSSASQQYKLVSSYDQMVDTSPLEHMPPTEEERSMAGTRAQDPNKLLVKAWEQKVFPVISRRFRSSEDRQSGLEQIRGALRAGRKQFSQPLRNEIHGDGCENWKDLAVADHWRKYVKTVVRFEKIEQWLTT